MRKIKTKFQTMGVVLIISLMIAVVGLGLLPASNHLQPVAYQSAADMRSDYQKPNFGLHASDVKSPSDWTLEEKEVFYSYFKK